MTSFIIGAHKDRGISETWKHNAECPFCRIIKNDLSAFKIYENDKVVAILDILPLRRGHTLVIPKTHYSRFSELPLEFAAAVGEAVTKVAQALTQALGNTALNVVCNQEYAQAVPHVHYHIIPAPSLESPTPLTITHTSDNSNSKTLTRAEMHKLEFLSREELDDNDAQVLVKAVRAKL